MTAYIGRRVLIGLVTVWFVSMLSFVIIQLPPGDYVTTYIAQLAEDNTTVSNARVEALRREYGLDQPVHVQYLDWMGHVVRGDFGQSLTFHRPVADIIGDRLPLSALLSLTSLLLVLLIAIPAGIYAGMRQYSKGDYVITFLGFIGMGVPEFLLALVFLYLGFTVFGANIGGLFSPGYENAAWSFGKAFDLLKHLPLPVVILAVVGTAAQIRIMRANLLDELRKPYVITARARGLSERRTTLKYPVRVALNPFAGGLGLVLPTIVSSEVIVSKVLNLPTLGPFLLRALTSQDMFLAGTIFLMLGIITVAGTLVADLVLMWLDPRVRYAIVEGR